jgi:hypothetical protein
MTQFQKDILTWQEGKLQIPVVMFGGKNVNYFGYKLEVHIMYMGLLAKGLKTRGFKFKEAKLYYGLKSNSAVLGYEELKKLRSQIPN